MSAWRHLALALLALGGCQAVDSLGPPEVVLGEDTCDYCHMIVTDERFLAAYIDPAGVKLIFDDIGGMVLHQRDTGTEVARWWVHDHRSAEWLDAEVASYAHCPALVTPMGYGVAAFASAGDAAAFASECGGLTLSFQELLARSFGGEGGGAKHSHEQGDTHA